MSHDERERDRRGLATFARTMTTSENILLEVTTQIHVGMYIYLANPPKTKACLRDRKPFSNQRERERENG